jgi:hypothetical protein
MFAVGADGPTGKALPKLSAMVNKDFVLVLFVCIRVHSWPYVLLFLSSLERRVQRVSYVDDSPF